MKKLYIIIILVLIRAVGAAGILTLDGSELQNPAARVGFFDPHNHTGGVLPPLALVNLRKYIYGDELTQAELKRFWVSLVNHYNQNFEEIKNDDRISSGTKMLLNCNEAIRYCSKLINEKKCREKIIDSINNLFSATPLTDFSTAYGMRNILFDIPAIPWVSSNLRTQAMLFSLAKSKVDLVEMSKVFIHGGMDEESTKDFTRFAEIIADLQSPTTSEKNLDFKKRLQDLELQVPRVKWLLMTHTLQLGKTSDTKTLTYASGKCEEITMPENLNVDPSTGIYSVLINFPDVVGVDVAGPETTCFTKRGMEDFKKLAEATYHASVAKRREKGNKGKLIVRAHVGEGFPISLSPQFNKQAQSCLAIEKFPEFETVHDREKLVQIHQIEARKNISYILNAIEELKLKHKDIDDFIIFRLGHLTHIDGPLAQKAENLGVTADANLSSNIATGAWPIDQEIINEYLIKRAITPNDIRSLRATLQSKGIPLGKLFDGHGLKWLLYYKVPVTMGSDAAGVEHSQSMQDEYEMTKELIKYWNAHDKDFASKNITIDDVLRNQKTHYEAMDYSYDLK